MSQTIEQLQEYIEKNKPSLKTTVYCGNSEITIDNNALSDIPTVNNFIDTVVIETYMNVITPSYFNSDSAFISFFLKSFTDFPVLTKEIDGKAVLDVQQTYDLARALNLDSNIMMLPDAMRLRGYVDKQIEFKNAKLIAFASTSSASDEAIESFSLVMKKALDLLDTITDQIEKNGDKLSSILSDESISNWFGKAQESMVIPQEFKNEFGDKISSLLDKISLKEDM